MRPIRTLLLGFALATLLPGVLGEAPSTRPEWVEILEGVRAALVDGRTVELRVQAHAGDGWITLGKRFLADPERWPDLAEANGGRRGPLKGHWYRVSWDLLRTGYRTLALRRLFPADGFQDGCWIHRPAGAAVETYGEGLWQIALWFTGDGVHFDRLAGFNELESPEVPGGMEIRIPAELLLPVFRDDPRTADGSLEFGADGDGPFALYTLREGEAIYSAVVVRFTGRVDPEEVNEAAGQVARRSEIRDVTKIPVGARIKVPLDLLSPEFLPRSDPRRIEYELGLGEARSVRKQAQARHLAGIHVILDPGHGGKDRGAQLNGVWESDYVYDVMTRIKRRLEQETAAQVHSTVKDKEIGYRVLDLKKLKANGAEVVLTSPEHRILGGSSTRMGVNLRWYLANSIYRRLRRQGVDRERVLFVSMHADSLHPSLRGAMIYVPGERYRRKTYGSQSGSYGRYKEVKEKSLVAIPRADRIRDEGLSRQFAGTVLDSFRKKGLPVHRYMPVRDHVVRSRQAWAPAVLRGNQVPTKILLELVNLRNKSDARMLQDPAFRQKLADALCEAFLEYYR